MSKYPERITTERLVLRRPRLTDAQAAFEEYGSDPEVTRYMIWPTHTSVKDAEAFLPVAIAHCESGEEYTWAITLKGTDRMVGAIAVRPAPTRIDIGYALARRLWGQGIMPEAARAVIDLALENPAIRRVQAMCDIDNRSSARVMQKLGMSLEGTLRRYAVHPNVSPEPRDALIYAMVR